MQSWLIAERPALLWVKIPGDENVLPMIPEGKTVDDAIGMPKHIAKEGE